MPLKEPRIFKIHFFGDLNSCGRAVEEIVRALNLESRDKGHTTSPGDFLKGLSGHVSLIGDRLLDTPVEFASDIHRLKVMYYPKWGAQKGDTADGVLVLTVAMHSGSPDVINGWLELERQFPANLPKGLLDPITIYHAISEEEVPAQEAAGLAKSLSSGPPPADFQGGLERATLRCGDLFQVGALERYFLFSSKEKESEASRFAVLSLPLFNLYLYSGDVIGSVEAARRHMKEVTEMIRDKLSHYSRVGFGSMTTEAERRDVFEIAKDLWILNANRSLILDLMATVDTALLNFRNLKERWLAPGPEEIFRSKESQLELQKAQLQTDAAYLHNTFESGRVVLDSIEDHMELEYSRELKESNRKALGLQSAAFIIEFAIVFYYFLGSWHYILGEKFYELPVYARFGCATVIASLLSAGTHLFARWRLTKSKSYFHALLGLLVPFLLVLGFVFASAFLF